MMLKKIAILFIISLSITTYAEGVTQGAAEGVTQGAAEGVAVEKPAETVKLAEKEIPLTIGTDKKKADGGATSTKALASGLIVVALLGASYYYVRKYKISNTINKSNMQIKVLTQHYLGPKKSLAIIHVAGESMLIGITDSNISMLKSLSLIDDEVDMPQKFNESFNESMVQKNLATRIKSDAQLDELDEEFSFSGVTDAVSKKIKSMRRFS